MNTSLALVIWKLCFGICHCIPLDTWERLMRSFDKYAESSMHRQPVAKVRTRLAAQTWIEYQAGVSARLYGEINARSGVVPDEG